MFLIRKNHIKKIKCLINYWNNDFISSVSVFILFFFIWFCDEWCLSYHESLLYVVPAFIRYLFQVIIGCFFGILYFYGLVILNDGILRLYFFVLVFIGYLFYQKYYAFSLLYYLEKFVLLLKRIIAPFRFFFRYINVIIQKRVKKVKLKWRRKKNQDIKNS